MFQLQIYLLPQPSSLLLSRSFIPKPQCIAFLLSFNQLPPTPSPTSSNTIIFSYPPIIFFISFLLSVAQNETPHHSQTLHMVVFYKVEWNIPMSTANNEMLEFLQDVFFNHLIWENRNMVRHGKGLMSHEKVLQLCRVQK